MHLRKTLIAASLLIATAIPATAATYYVAPLGTNLTCTPNGSATCPWTSVAAAFASNKIVGGDTILLKDGSHGELSINKRMYDKTVTIQSENGRNAHISSAHFGAETKNIALKNLKVWRPEGSWAGFLIRSYNGSSALTLEGLDIRSREDGKNYLTWSKERWVAVASNAVDMRGSSIIRNNHISGVGRGIVAGSNSLVEGNVVEGFVWDGLRGVGNSTFRNNLVKNVFKVDSVHRDGFQSYSSGTVRGLTVEGNVFIQWALKTTSPLQGTMQGIGLFDGYYEDLVIRNNVVAVSHYHGITVLGTRRASIVNNTVVHINGASEGHPWVRVSSTKAGLPSSDVVVANNVAMKFLGGDAANNVVFTHNSAMLSPAKVLQDVANFNYQPKMDSGFIDTANVTNAPPTDILGTSRPSGKGPDRGAYEMNGTTTTTSTTTTPTTTTPTTTTPTTTTPTTTTPTTTTPTTTTPTTTTPTTTTPTTTTPTLTSNGAKRVKAPKKK
jgi:hypothetical protein